MNCNICYEDTSTFNEDNFLLFCGSSEGITKNSCSVGICKNCIEKWITKSDECPNCKRKKTFDVNYPNNSATKQKFFVDLITTSILPLPVLPVVIYDQTTTEYNETSEMIKDPISNYLVEKKSKTGSFIIKKLSKNILIKNYAKKTIYNPMTFHYLELNCNSNIKTILKVFEFYNMTYPECTKENTEYKLESTQIKCPLLNMKINKESSLGTFILKKLSKNILIESKTDPFKILNPKSGKYVYKKGSLGSSILKKYN